MTKPTKSRADGPAERICLYCDEPFPSTHKGNRICRQCHTYRAERVGSRCPDSRLAILVGGVVARHSPSYVPQGVEKAHRESLVQWEGE